jgi:hypothetical protein
MLLGEMLLQSVYETILVGGLYVSLARWTLDG